MELVEVELVLISHHLDDGCKDQTEDSVDHGDVRQFSAISAEEATTFVVILLTRVSDVRQLACLSLHREVVD